MGFALIGYSFPSFFIALLMLYFFCLTPMPFTGEPIMPVPHWIPAHRQSQRLVREPDTARGSRSPF